MAKKDEERQAEQVQPLTTEEAKEAGQAEQERINEEQEYPQWPPDAEPGTVPEGTAENPPQPPPVEYLEPEEDEEEA